MKKGEVRKVEFYSIDCPNCETMQDTDEINNSNIYTCPVCGTQFTVETDKNCQNYTKINHK